MAKKNASTVQVALGQQGGTGPEVTWQMSVRSKGIAGSVRWRGMGKGAERGGEGPMKVKAMATERQKEIPGLPWVQNRCHKSKCRPGNKSIEVRQV